MTLDSFRQAKHAQENHCADASEVVIKGFCERPVRNWNVERADLLGALEREPAVAP
jgi:hypothetical protein